MSAASGLSSQLEVLGALILRETRTRFGAHQLGYLWAYLSPLMWIATFYLMFSVLGRQAPPGMSMAGFIATGLIPFSVFRECVNRSANAVDSNKGLLFYPQVRPLDLIIARATLEGATGSSVLFGILLVDGLHGGKLEIDDPLLTLMALFMAMLLGMSIGITVGSLSVFSSAVSRIAPAVMRPVFWISGIFFTVSSLPSQVRESVLLNPVLHLVEMVRAGFYKDYASPDASPAYVALWIVLSMAFGLSLERVARRRLEMT